MVDPFRIDGPAVISFSGGRTSGLMLCRILDSHGGTLPPDVFVIFANTGREMEGTLEFVRECGERWGVPIMWAERTDGPHTDKPPSERFREVTFATASRNGEPLAALWKERTGLSNPRQRSCTQECKIRVMKSVMRSKGYDHWDNIVGLRADERRRVLSVQKNAQRERWEVLAPLCDAGIVKSDVLAWWSRQPFDLRLSGEWEGNCDGCFLKRLASKVRVAGDHPKRWSWWIEQERLAVERMSPTDTGARFRLDHPSCAKIAEMADRTRLPVLPGVFADEDLAFCESCTD